GVAELRQNFSRLAVVVEVDQKRELDGETVLDLVLLPFALAAAARILVPEQSFAEPGTAHDIDVAVAVYVERQIAEVVYVVVGIVQRAELVFRPARALVPVFSGDDIRLAVAIDISHGARFAAAQVERVLLKRDLVRTGQGPGQPGSQAQRDGDISHHALDCSARLSTVTGC